MKITMVGTGAYSLALSHSLSKKNNEICMWTHDMNIENEYKNSKKLKSIIDCEINENISVTTSLEIAIKNAKLIYICTASKYFKDVVLQIKPYYKKNIPICIATKGLDDITYEFLSNIVKKNLKTKCVSVLSGPTFAIDIINNEPVGLALATKSNTTGKLVKRTLENETLKLRINNDLIGVQICGSIKNCVAIAAGILNGLGYSNSATAFLINEAMHDIRNAIYYLGGKKSTILSFAGIGDLLLTCTSKKSRNFSFGYTIGKYNDINKTNEFLKNNTVEGYYALTTIKKLFKNKQLKVPMINLIYDIVYNGKDPELLVKFLIKKE